MFLGRTIVSGDLGLRASAAFPWDVADSGTEGKQTPV